MGKQVIRINESQLKRIISESVRRIMKENFYGSINESMEDVESNDIKIKEYDAIGFANKFYTLWHVIEREYSKTYVFRKNISFSKEKAFKLYPDAVYDEKLRGKSRSFTISVGSGESVGERGWSAVPQTIVEKGSKIHIKQFLVTNVGYKVSRYGKPYTYFMGEDLNSSYGFDFYVNIFNNDKSLVPQKGDIIELEGVVGVYNERNEDIYLNDCHYTVDNNNSIQDIEPNIKIEEEMVVISNILPVYNTTGRFLEKPGMIIFQNEEGNEFVVDTVVEDFRTGSPTIKFENYRDIHRGDKFLVKGTTQIKNGMGRLIRVKLKLLEPYDPTENTQDGPNVRLITVRENISQKQGRQNTITSSKMYHLKTIDEIDKFVLHVWGIVEKYNCITGYSSKEELKQKILNIINDYQNKATNGFQIILEIPQTKEQISYVLTIYYN